jgi:hypothetical protein
MKGVFFLVVFGLGLIGFNGCYTVPHHYTYVEEVIFYPPPPTPPPPDYYYPPQTPSPPVYYPPAPEQPKQNKDRQPEQPKDSYKQRDPLQGGSGRGSDEIKTVPPVRTPERKDRGQR